MKRTACVFLLSLLVSFAALAAPRTADFNGDGYLDLAVGVPLEDDGAVVDAGGVQIIYGAAGGLSSGSVYWDQDNVPDLPGFAEPNDQFGAALAWGDFNGDGYDDLAIGMPGQAVGGAFAAGAGAVMVIYGGATGLDPMNFPNAQIWHQNSPGVPEDAEAGDSCGWVVTAGDFDNDGLDDLAVGCPFEGLMVNGSGFAFTLYGTAAAGLTGAGSQPWHQDIAGIADVAEVDDHFSLAMTTGDFDGDGYDDLAVGVPHEDLGMILDAGAINLIYGTGAGLAAPGNQFVHQDVVGILGVAAADDEFGTAIAAGDFNGDGFHDLAAGVPYEDGGAIVDGGAVNVILGSIAGLTNVGDQLWHQAVAGLASDGPENSDNFGLAVAAGDFNNDLFDDLVVGVPFEDVGAIADAGAVHLILGSAASLTSAGSLMFDENSTAVDPAEASDLFGSTLVAMDFSGDGLADLAAGAPMEDSPGGAINSGAMFIINGDAAGWTPVGADYREQDALSDGAVAPGDGYGGGVYGP